ncbi:glomulin isoform X1 [Aedes aegypti]|uniref:Glomulin n=1 Tax=Aedes aegypti TaxID=7159 RepID=A0A0P6IVQ6_AEDAE|nr:glomulin isoform X1 [Aedes aegypti]
MSLVNLVKFKLKSKEFKDVFNLLRENENGLLQTESMDMVSALVDNLNEALLLDDSKLLSVCEDLLKLVAEKCSPQEVLLELLEKIETTKDDDIFTSLLKVLQVVLLRFNENKVRSLEWSLNTIYSYMDQIVLPDYISKVGADEGKLLESDEIVQRVLLLYMTILLFLEPIWKTLNSDGEIFKTTKMSRKNVVICFILQLMGNHLIYLDIHHKPGKIDTAGVAEGAKTYSRQVAEDLVSAMCSLLGDPYQLLSYGERRKRWSSSKWYKKPNPTQNIFMNEDKCPMLALAMYHYLLIGEDLQPKTSPAVYTNLHLFEMGLYYCTELITNEHIVVHHKGIVLGMKSLEKLGAEKLFPDNLDVEIHQQFCKGLSNLIVYSSSESNRKDGTMLLRDYILHFDSEGRYLVISNLFKTVQHSGLHSFVATIYKDLISQELSGNNTPSPWFVGKSLKHLLLTEICVLKNGIETDLVENADTIITGLNVLRFLLLRDKLNKTSIWEYMKELEHHYLYPLRKSIDLAKAHFKEERLKTAQASEGTSNHSDISVSIINSGPLPELTREKKLELLTHAMNQFDLMECLLARVLECINLKPINT